MSNRLVPMPTNKPQRPAKAPEAQPAAAIAGLQSWHTFAFLIVIAVLWLILDRGLFTTIERRTVVRWGMLKR